MRIQITSTGKAQNITELVPNVKWSGDYRNAARELSFSVLSSPTDKGIPTVDCPLGANVQLTEGGNLLFDGYIFNRSRNIEQSSIAITCFDRGIHLKKNKISRKVSGELPEAVTAALAREFGLTVGQIAATGIPVTRNFFGVSIYDAVMTMYTLASRQTGKRYYAGFRGGRLSVTEGEPNAETLVIRGQSNLIGLSTTESIEDMVNDVGIYDANDRLVEVKEDAQSVRLYGRMQEYLKQSGQDNRLSEASTLLEENGVKQELRVDSLGDTRCVAGNCVTVEEPFTRTKGLFFIEKDIHEWKRGQYYNNLTLNFKRLMDEKEAGSEVG